MDCFELLLFFVGLVGFAIIDIDVFEHFFLYDDFFGWLLDEHLFDNSFFHLLDDLFSDINRYLNNFLDPPFPSFQPLNRSFAFLMIFRYIAAFETATQHGKFHLTLLLQTVLFLRLLMYLYRLILLIHSDAALLVAAADKWHQPGVGFLLLLVDVDGDWHLNDNVFLDVDWNFFDS